MALLEKDTSDYDDVAKQCHDQMLAFLNKDLFG
uniref:Uncharacterized protein n=1 Tax=Arundo donax TaxID=35708 RepID=A0A0A9FD37_ARUDO